MNLVKSELAEHLNVLNAFRELPADLKRYIQTFYVSTCPSK